MSILPVFSSPDRIHKWEQSTEKMLASPVKILLIEDDLAQARLLQEILKDAKEKTFTLVHVQRLQEAISKLNSNYFDVVLLDLTLPDSHGLASLGPLNEYAPSIPIVVLTNTNDERLALEAVRQGAQDYLVKRQVNLDSLVRSLSYAIERKQNAENLRKSHENLAVQVKQQKEDLVKALEVNQLRAELVSMISHDFRNPLTTILLSTGLLEDHEQKLTNEQKIRQYQRIRGAIKDLTGLLDEILLVGKAEAGKLSCELVALALEPFCRKLVEELQLASNNNQELFFSSSGELNTGLWDKQLLKHILFNLLSNAIKYSPEGGLITLRLERKEEWLLIRVSDQGMGIPEADLQGLFEPFHRGENVDSIPGTGLGLAIVKNCVEVHGGTIQVSSKLGMGSTFKIMLPFREI